jgi:hypothetical protein
VCLNRRGPWRGVFRDFPLLKGWFILVVKFHGRAFFYKFYLKCIINPLKDFKQESDMNLLCFKNIYEVINRLTQMKA